MKRVGRVFLIGLIGLVFILAVAALTAFYRFPYASGAKYLESQAESGGRGRLIIENLRPGLPFVFKMDELRIGVRGNQGSFWLIDAGQVKVRWNPLALLIGQVKGSIAGVAWGGKFKARFEVSLGKDKAIWVRAEKLDFPIFQLPGAVFNGSLDGRLNGTFTLAGNLDSFPTQGEGSLQLTQGHYSGPLPPLSQIEKTLDSVNLKFHIVDSAFQLQALDIMAKDAEIKISGEIPSILQPQLNLKGEAALGLNPATRSKFSFGLTGPLSSPNISLNMFGALPGAAPAPASPTAQPSGVNTAPAGANRGTRR